MTPSDPSGKPRVLIVGVNYAPEATGIAPYTTHIAEHLAHGGCEVTVLAGPPSYPKWRVDPADRGWHRVEQRGPVQVHRLWHYVPSKQTGFRRAAYELSFGLHSSRAGRKLDRRPDVVLAVIPSLAGARAAARIARDAGAPLLIHLQDLMGRAASESGIRGGTWLAGATSRLEQSVLRQASRVLVVSEAFMAPVESYGVPSDRIGLLPNWTHISAPTRDREQTRLALGWHPQTKVALHTGNMGWKQDLDNVVEAARLSVGRPDLLWVLMGDGSQRQSLAERGRGLSNLSFLPPCDEAEYPEILGAADVLLVNERPSVSEMSLPSKLTSYAAVNRPVVAAVPLGGATAEAAKRMVDATIVEPGDAHALVEAVSAVSDGSLALRDSSEWLIDWRSLIDQHISGAVTAAAPA